MPCAPPAGRGFFPLDEELALLPGSYSPFVHESLVRLGTWLPFEQVPEALAHFTQVCSSPETARRLTEAVGAALVAAETAVVEELERTWPAPAVPTERHQVSVDGTMVPLVHGEWAEVKVLAIGAVRAPDAAGEVHTTAWSYFGRLTDAETFRRLAWGETHRRGITLARDTCALSDGAEWCQSFFDWHCPDAQRILDFIHAAQYVSTAGGSVWAREAAALTAWLDQQLAELKTGDPDRVLGALRALPLIGVPGPEGVSYPREVALRYLDKRRPQIAYAAFRAAGYPIGSGGVESANKVVVGARLDGSGMHWARANVNPMLALRSAACSHRWQAVWDQVCTERQHHRTAQRAARTAARQAARAPTSPPPAPASAASARAARRRVAKLPLGLIRDGKPAPNHPWRRGFEQRQQPKQAARS
jgi:hypothetical protein